MKSRVSWGLFRSVVGALALLVATPVRAAEFDFGIFGGAHLFNPENELGAYDNDGDINVLQHGPLFGLRGSYHFIPRLAVELELAGIVTTTRDTGVLVGGLAYRGHLLLNILTGRVRPFVLAGAGGMTSFSENTNVLYDDTDGMFHFGAGVKVDLTKLVGLRFDARALLPPSRGTNLVTVDGELMLGIYFRFPLSNRPYNPDSDRDGVPDLLDQCPDEKGVKENDGCKPIDSDADAIFDRKDKCPDKAGPADNGGCPWGDRDNDGVPDNEDRCPGMAGLTANGGCPDLDSDGDGIVDSMDKCPGENGPIENRGCPVPKDLARYTGTIEGIVFEINRAEIKPESTATLDRAAEILSKYDYIHLQIEGHTDTIGDIEWNRSLSQRRADSVKKYLVNKGIAEKRLVAKGFGPDKPRESNDTMDGRRKNRRVEFTLIKGDE